jgi:hypothetical protein
VLLDFDMTHTFQPIPADDPLNATSFNLLPVVHVSNLGETGGVEGTVSRDPGTGLEPVPGATVYVLPPGQTDPDAAVATTVTGATGEYAVLALQPGTYDVRAVMGTDAGTATGVVVVAGQVAQADVTLTSGP